MKRLPCTSHVRTRDQLEDKAGYKGKGPGCPQPHLGDETRTKGGWVLFQVIKVLRRTICTM